MMSTDLINSNIIYNIDNDDNNTNYTNNNNYKNKNNNKILTMHNVLMI